MVDVEKRKSSLKDVLPWLVVVCVFVRWLVLELYPAKDSVERLWLAWTGRQILSTGTLPHALGSETLTAQGAHWLPQEWALATIIAWCQQHNSMMAFHIVFAALACVPFIVLIAQCQKQKIDIIMTVAALFVLVHMLEPIFQVRANSLAIASTAVFLWALSKGGRWIWLTPPLVAITCNLHASGLFLSLLPIVLLVPKFLDQSGCTAEFRQYAAAALASFIASFCTPFGYGLWKYTLILSNPAAHKYSSEWDPLWTNPAYCSQIAALLIVGLTLYGIKIKAKTFSFRFMDAALIALTFAMNVYAERFMSLFALVITPLAFGVSPAEESDPLVDSVERGPETLLAVGISVLAALVTLSQPLKTINQPRTFDTAMGIYAPAPWRFPDVLGNIAEQRVFCGDFAECDTFLNAGARVFSDGRFDPYPASTWQQTSAINFQQGNWLEILQTQRINVIIANTGSQLETALKQRPEWQERDREDGEILYAREFHPKEK